MKPETMIRLDETDRKLLTILSTDNTLKYAELGVQLNLSAPAVFERVKRLKKEKVITGSVFTLDGVKLGKPLLCFVHVSINTIERGRQIAKLSSIPDIQEIHSITGSSGVMIKIRTKDTQELEKILSTIHEIEGVTGTNTEIVLSTLLERGVSAD